MRNTDLSFIPNLVHLFLLWSFSVVRSQGLDLEFTKEPASTIAKRGDSVILFCNTNTSGNGVTWHFNDVILISESGPDHQRRKRFKDDRNHPESGLSTDRLSKRRKSRGKKDKREKKTKKRNNEDETHRYVRSDDRAKFIEANSLGVRINNDSLKIPNFDSRNSGSYYCVVSTSTGSIRSKTATVQFAYLRNFASLQPKIIKTESTSAVIPCDGRPESLPPALIKWKINGLPMNTGDHGLYQVLPSGNLLVKNATSLSGSQFRCSAENSVTAESKASPISTTLLVEEVQGATRLISPTTEMAINVTAKVGEQILMECVSSDLSKFIWTRDNGDIPDSAKITEVGLNFTAAESDGGSYVCRLKNGSVAAQYILAVKESPQCQPSTSTHFTAKPKGEAITMGCSSKSGTSTWKWYYNGDRIPTAKGPEFNASDIYGYGDGFYQCFMENEFGACSVKFLVEPTGPKNGISSVEFTISEDYFHLDVDDKVPAPTVEATGTPTSPTSHIIHWTVPDSGIMLTSIKYYKEPIVNGSKPVHYPHMVVNVPADRTSVTITGLDPSSYYYIEMVVVSSKRTRSEMTISSFRTGQEEPRQPEVNNKKPKQDNEGPKHENGRGGQVPRSPSRPTVNQVSVHRASLMWRSHGNGGSPILGYKVQMKEVEAKDGWRNIGETKSYPYEVNGLQRGKTYRFRIIAHNAAGESKASPASRPYPKSRVLRPLNHRPFITKARVQGSTSIIIDWTYEIVPSQIGGYYIFYRPTDMDNEEDYKVETLKIPTASSYVILNISPGMQYDVKIQAFNDLGKSPMSNVRILEVPKPGTDIPGGSVPSPSDPGIDPNSPARQMAHKRNMIFLISGCVVAGVMIVLLFTVFCYWRKRGAQKDQSTPQMKQKNGNVGSVEGKQCDHIGMSKLNSNGHATPNEAGHSHSRNHSPHDTRCHCSRHQSSHSSLGRDGNSYAAYPLPQGGYQHWHPGNYPNFNGGPMHLFMDPRHPYFQHHGIGRWVRGGEFCHIIPVDARKMSADGGAEIERQYVVPGSQMVTMTYDGNLTSANNSVHRPDHGYHSNDEGIRTGSDSQPEKSDDTNHSDDDANSAGAATSGVVTLNDAPIDSRPSSPLNHDGDDEETPETSQLNHETIDQMKTDVSKSSEENCDSLKICNDENENTPFLVNDINNASVS